MDNKQKLKQKLQKKKVLKKKLQTKVQESLESPSEIRNDVVTKPINHKTVQNAQKNDNNTSTNRKASNEIDDIFANVKKKAGTEPKEEAPKKRTRPQADDDGFFDSRGTTSKRKSTDGLKIYSEDELGLTKNLTGGGTALCPFDCDCCF